MNNKTIRIKTMLMAIGLSSLLIGCVGSGSSFGDSAESDVGFSGSKTNKGLIVKYTNDSNVVTHNYLVDTKCLDGEEYLNSSTANYIEYEKDTNIGKKDSFNGKACIDGNSLKIKYSYSNKHIINEDLKLQEKNNIKYGETTLNLLESKEIKEPGFDGSILFSWYGEQGGIATTPKIIESVNVQEDTKKVIKEVTNTNELKVSEIKKEVVTVKKEIIEVKKDEIDPEIAKLQRELDELNKELEKPSIIPQEVEKLKIEQPTSNVPIIIEPAKKEIKSNIEASKQNVSEIIKTPIIEKKEVVKPMIIIKDDEERPADEKVSISQSSSMIKIIEPKQTDEYIEQTNNWIVSEDELINDEKTTTKKPKSENIVAKTPIIETPIVEEIEEVKEESNNMFDDF